MRKIVFLLLACFVGFGAYADGRIIEETVIECDGQQCAKRPRSSEIVGGCDAFGVECTQASGRAERAKCVKIRKESGGAEELSCAAKECKDKYWLWVSGGYSMGVCHSIEETIRFCKKNGMCGEGCDCVPNEIPNPNNGYGGRAYDECHCVPKEEPVQPNECAGLQGAEWECCMAKKSGKPVKWDPDANNGAGACVCEDGRKWDWENSKCIDEETVSPNGKKCYYQFDGYQKCGDKQVYVHKNYPVSEEFMRKITNGDCRNIQELVNQDKEEFARLVAEVCKEFGAIVDEDDAKVNEAKERLDAFMRSAQMNVDVWKNSEGKFNTARLASDLTAGVVLGTVGGIVSANIIKKKQVEKGFDALNCSVGGQKVADWGDEFTVGLRRY